MAVSHFKNGGTSISGPRNSSSIQKLKRKLFACPQPHIFLIFITCAIFFLTLLSHNSYTAPWFTSIFCFTNPSGSDHYVSSFYNYYCSLPSSSPPPPASRKDEPFRPPPTNSSSLSPKPAQVSSGNAVSNNHIQNTLPQEPSFEFRNESATNYTTGKTLSLDEQEPQILAVTNSSNPAEPVGDDFGLGKRRIASKDSRQNVERIDDLVKELMDCDMFDGEWVRDESYPLYKPGSCNLIDEQFNCFLNGRPDHGYYKLKWKPKACTLPRLDGSHMLELLRGKRLVFVGDSLNRNMWESLVCILRNSVKDKEKVYEQSGRKYFRYEASFTFVFQEYNCTVELFVSPFLVQEWKGKNGRERETLRLDVISRYGDKYKNADIIVFNTGHWWTHDKTSTGKNYYQEGNHVYPELNVLEAFRKALSTWGRWIDGNVDPTRSMILFRGYSASHFSGGQWNSGGQCDGETEAIRDENYLTKYPPMMRVLEQVLEGMRTRVTYLNVTRMTDYRKDGHPSIYRRQQYLSMSEEEKKRELNIQDCSHWCLPGVPDAWNEILYAHLLVRLGTMTRDTGTRHT